MNKIDKEQDGINPDLNIETNDRLEFLMFESRVDTDSTNETFPVADDTTVGENSMVTGHQMSEMDIHIFEYTPKTLR